MSEFNVQDVAFFAIVAMVLLALLTLTLPYIPAVFP
jgi:hypothetical protein